MIVTNVNPVPYANIPHGDPAGTPHPSTAIKATGAAPCWRVRCDQGTECNRSPLPVELTHAGASNNRVWADTMRA
jgi:hypothetical protein